MDLSSTKLDAKELASGTHGDSLLDVGECCPFSPMIDDVDKEEDRSCSVISWCLHTDRWSLSAEEGGGRRVDDNKNDVGAKGKDNGRCRRPPRADADEVGMPLLLNGLSSVQSLEQGAHRRHPPPPFAGPDDDRRQEGEQVAGKEAHGSERCYKIRVLWYLRTVLTYQSHVTTL